MSVRQWHGHELTFIVVDLEDASNAAWFVDAWPQPGHDLHDRAHGPYRAICVLTDQCRA